MDSTETRSDEEYDFPELELQDLIHLKRLHSIHGRDRVAGWLRANIAVPLNVEFGDGTDEDDYYEALVDHYLEMVTEDEEEGCRDAVQ